MKQASHDTNIREEKMKQDDNELDELGLWYIKNSQKTHPYANHVVSDS
jgi:hypothetical protein